MPKAAARWRRAPVAAGLFYPARPETLRAQLAEFAANAPPPTPAGMLATDAAIGASANRAAPAPIRGAICPHAGYLYSGQLTWWTLARCPWTPTVLILAVNHRHPRPPAWAIWPEGAWQTPLGEVPVDAELAAVLQAALPEWTASESSHLRDHSTEVLLPFLQELSARADRPTPRIVPVCPFLNREDEPMAPEIGRRLAAVLATWREPVLVVASNDMTHFAPADIAHAQDRKALAPIARLDAAGLLTTARRERVTMCGAQPVATMLSAVRELGATQGDLVGYTHSGVVSGDWNEVVAYAGVVCR